MASSPRSRLATDNDAPHRSRDQRPVRGEAPMSVALPWVLTGLAVTLFALLAGPDAWAEVDAHKWESLACILDISGVPFAWGVVSLTRGATQLSLANPWTLQPWLLRGTADAYYFPVDSCQRLLKQPFGEAGLIATACVADSAYFLLELVAMDDALLVAEVIRTAGQARACLAAPPPPPPDAAAPVGMQCTSRWAHGRAAQSCASDSSDSPSYCARLPWHAVKMLVVGALPAGAPGPCAPTIDHRHYAHTSCHPAPAAGTHAYFLLDQIDLAYELVTRPP